LIPYQGMNHLPCDLPWTIYQCQTRRLMSLMSLKELELMLSESAHQQHTALAPCRVPSFRLICILSWLIFPSRNSIRDFLCFAHIRFYEWVFFTRSSLTTHKHF